MAKPKMKREQINRYLSFVDPINTELSLYDEDEENEDESNAGASNVTNKGGINNLGASLKRGGDEYVTSQLARPSTTLPAAEVTQKSNITPPSSVRIPRNITLPGSVTRMQPMLGGGADLSRVANSFVTDFDLGNSGNVTPPARTSLPGNIPTARETAEQITPEEKLLAALANTNPSPQSFWKRILTGAVQGAARVTPDDTGGSAFGKIAGNVIARSIPAIDSANLYNENVGRAKERYAVESTARNARLNRRKIEADIQDTELKRIQAIEDRAERTRQARLLDAARLRDDKRAEAKLRLDALKDLPADSPQREELANELRSAYGINIDKGYGLLDKTRDKELSEGEIKTRATSEVMNEIGANVEKIARDSTNNKPQIIAAREAMQRVLNDPSASNIKKAQAREDFEKLYKAELQTNIDYTKSDVDSRIRKREGELRGTAKRSNKPGKGKVQASSKAQAVNFAQPGATLKFK